MQVKRFPKFTFILVTWEDPTSDAKWYDKQDIDKMKTTVVRTMGFFLGNKKRVLKVAHSITADGDSDFTAIPWGCIKEVKGLKEIT